MKYIELSKGYKAIVDDEDYTQLSNYSWSVDDGGKNTKVYARTNINRKHTAMHRMILGIVDPKIQVDHINGDGLDNRRVNLRTCTQSQNQGNRLPTNKTCKYKGVYIAYNSKNPSYVAQIKSRYLGRFKDPIEAAKAYDKAAIKEYGEFARTNEQLGLI